MGSAFEDGHVSNKGHRVFLAVENIEVNIAYFYFIKIDIIVLIVRKQGEGKVDSRRIGYKKGQTVLYVDGENVVGDMTDVRGDTLFSILSGGCHRP